MKNAILLVAIFVAADSHAGLISKAVQEAFDTTARLSAQPTAKFISKKVSETEPDATGQSDLKLHADLKSYQKTSGRQLPTLHLFSMHITRQVNQ